MRAQVSLEFVMITGISLLIVGSSAFLLLDYTKSAGDQTALDQVADVGYRIVDEARNVYVYGPGSFTTVTASFPENILDVYVVDAQAIVFELNTQDGVVQVPIFSEVEIRGFNEDDGSGPADKIYGGAMSMGPGRAEIRVTSTDDPGNPFVKIEMIG